MNDAWILDSVICGTLMSCRNFFSYSSLSVWGIQITPLIMAIYGI